MEVDITGTELEKGGHCWNCNIRKWKQMELKSKEVEKFGTELEGSGQVGNEV
jgi:hypothetical protein